MSAAEILAPGPAPKPTLIHFGATPDVIRVRHDQLQPSPLNPRKHARPDEAIAELADAIAARGILQNLVVRRLGKNKYEIAAGEGRWLAVGHLIKAGRATGAYLMPVSVRDLCDDDMIEIGLIENGQRNDLHPLDEAKAFAALYDARVKAAGGKAKAAGIAAGGAVVKSLADKMGRTPRYVQKRIHLARNLAPAATDLLEKGAINLVVAQELSQRTPEEQKKFLRFTRRNTETLTAADVRESFVRQWRAMSDAIFAPGIYKGAITDVDGVVYATDRKLFDRLQHEAAVTLERECLKAAKDGKIKFFEKGDYFHDYEFKVVKVAGKPDPAGGVFMAVDKYQGTVGVHRGLAKTADRIARDKRNASFNGRVTRVSTGPIRRSDKRVPALATFCAASPATMMAVQLYDALSGWQERLQFFRPNQYRGRDAAKAQLSKLHNGALPKGYALVAWLLKRKPAELAAAWATLAGGEVRSIPVVKVSKADELLFAHAGLKPSPKKGKAK